jgi:hypothetical protein
MKTLLTKTWMLWVLTTLITLTSVVYQKKTGPTYPVRGAFEQNGTSVKYKLLRSHETGLNAPVEFEVSGTPVEALLISKRYHSNDEWGVKKFILADNKYKTDLKELAPAGKMTYRIQLNWSDGKTMKFPGEPVILRYKGAVPLFILIPHILFMFIAMFVGTRAALEAFAKKDNAVLFSWIALISLSIGGLFLGPIVQKYAFDAYWTGWPIGTDLTDNKTAFSVLFWVFALWKNHKEKTNPKWIIIAGIVLLSIYLIPHSTLGSEIDYTTISPIAS